MLPKVPDDITQIEKKIKKDKELSVVAIKKSISMFFILIGLFFIASQIIPLLKSYIHGYSLVTAQERPNIIPVTGRFLKNLLSDTYYDPGTKYFQTLVQNVKKPEVKIDSQYKKIMYITIPGTPIKRIRITPNVPSSPKKVYEKALDKGVAHLKYTPLPGDGGVSIIYGHSGIPSLLSKKIKPKLIFTKLEDVNLGDKIIIERDGRKLYYTVVSKKIIAPTELDLLHNLSVPPEKLVLLTCWPSGIGTKRLVIIADRVQ